MDISRGETEAPRTHQRLGLWGVILLTTIPAMACGWTPEPSQTPGVNSLHLSWVWPKEEAELQSGLAVGPDGTFYVTDTQSTLYAINSSGEEIWRYHGDYDAALPPTLSHDGKTLYFLADEDTLYAVETDGQLRWAYQTHGVHHGISINGFAVAPDDTVYFLTGFGDRWYHILPDGEIEILPLSTDLNFKEPSFDRQGRLYSRGPYDFWVISPSGEALHKCEEGNSWGISFGPTGRSQGGFLYSLRNGEVVARDTECHVIWRHTLQEEETVFGERLFDPLPLVVDADETIYVGGQAGRLYALDSEGALLWQSDSDPSAGDLVHLTLGDEAIFAVGNGGNLLAFDREGNRVWSHPFYEAGFPGPPLTTPGGGVAIVQAGRLQVYTKDAAKALQQPTPLPPPADAAQAEKEIIAFLINRMLGREITDVPSDEQPWPEEPAYPSIVIWAPVKGASTGNAILDYDHPIRAWWYTDNQFIETKDKTKAVEECRLLYLERPYVEDDPRSSAFYHCHEFGIISIAEGNRSAEAYMARSCDVACGTGYRYTLRRSPSGQWWVASSRLLWVS